MVVVVFVDMFILLVIDLEEFESECDVIFEEFVMVDDDLLDVVSEWFFEGVFGVYLFGCLIGGSFELIGVVGCDVVWFYYCVNYWLQDLVVMVVGVVDYDILVVGIIVVFDVVGWDFGVVGMFVV